MTDPKNVLKKEKKKLRRIKFPKTLRDHATNFLVDYKNHLVHIKLVRQRFEKLEWESYQMKQAFEEILKLAQRKKKKDGTSETS